MRGAIRDFIEDATPYKVCDAVDHGVSAIHKATESRCDLILLHLSTSLQDVLVTVPSLRSKLPHVKIVGLSTFAFDLGNQVSTATGFDAVIAQEQGLSKLVETPEGADARATTRVAAARFDGLPKNLVAATPVSAWAVAAD